VGVARGPPSRSGAPDVQPVPRRARVGAAPRRPLTDAAPALLCGRGRRGYDLASANHRTTEGVSTLGTPTAFTFVKKDGVPFFVRHRQCRVFWISSPNPPTRGTAR